MMLVLFQRNTHLRYREWLAVVFATSQTETPRLIGRLTEECQVNKILSHLYSKWFSAVHSFVEVGKLLLRIVNR